jgi:diacylglycerol O-acyltransferase / wax synthase
LSVKKRFGFSDEMEVGAVKKIGKKAHAKINDVMLTCLAGALDRYRFNKEKSENLYEIRVGMPYNVRTSPKITELRNEFAFMLNPIPLGVKDGYKRMSMIKKTMDYAKKIPEPWFGYFISSISSYLPLSFLKNLGAMSQYLTAVLTNMVGGDEKLKFIGHTVELMSALVPPPDGVGIGVAVMSQAGKMYVSITTDKELIPDPQYLVDCFIEEYKELKNKL